MGRLIPSSPKRCPLGPCRSRIFFDLRPALYTKPSVLICGSRRKPAPAGGDQPCLDAILQGVIPLRCLHSHGKLHPDRIVALAPARPEYRLEPALSREFISQPSSRGGVQELESAIEVCLARAVCSDKHRKPFDGKADASEGAIPGGVDLFDFEHEEQRCLRYRVRETITRTAHVVVVRNGDVEKSVPDGNPIEVQTVNEGQSPDCGTRLQTSKRIRMASTVTGSPFEAVGSSERRKGIRRRSHKLLP